jgi:hypothetical protein
VAGIIVEGAEQSGKSTLSRHLADTLGFELVHYGPAPIDFDYYSGYFRDIESRPGGYIYDRSYVSELVYGSLFRRNNIDAQLQQKIERRFSELGYVFVLCHWDGDWIDREETVTQDQNRTVAATYDRVFESISLPKLRLCPRRDPRSIDMVIGLLRGQSPV